MKPLHLVLAPAPGGPWDSPALGVEARRRASRRALEAAAHQAGIQLPDSAYTPHEQHAAHGENGVHSEHRRLTPPRDSHGAPLPLGRHHWTVSHTRHFVAAALWTGAVGVDVEGQRNPSAALRERAASSEERAILANHWQEEEAFARLWTAKEAVCKATGLGLAGLSRTVLRAVLWAAPWAVNGPTAARAAAADYNARDMRAEHSDARLSLSCDGAEFTITQGPVPAAPPHWWSLCAAGDPPLIVHHPAPVLTP
ncbi:MAG: 4'-phosphopantetheinyl transferase superfamily protein [Planctomycetota bacterium]|nr:hypothetical protein [Planctomycetota bacterium]MDP6518513.1 4'-phosphopantetheinyl transferase superfamily protein [Planctomycetota bacterium]MDP6838933.1 4'-phosphopantetheinyl transferase superfamily protein [Planctomycetota bacterium]MDP6956299.1 4'-phosphopantetheinyl transferase superfamily protein [Planctomycetota bacterium]